MSTPIGQTLSIDQQMLDLLRAGPGVRQQMSPGRLGIRPVLLGEHPVSTEVNTLTPLAGMGMTIARTISKITPVAPSEHIGVILFSRERSIDAFRHLAQWGVRSAGERPASIGLRIDSPSFPIVITPNAEKFSKSLGLYGSLVRTTEIVHKILPTSKALNVDVKKDPDEGGYPTICFAITIAESVDRVLELDDALQDMLYDSLPTDHRPHLSFTYHFE